MSELRELAEFIVHLDWDHVPEEVRERTKACCMDTVGVGVGASTNEQIGHVRDMYLAISGTDRRAEIWGSGQQSPLLTAVFLNAMMSHVLELDDVHTRSKTHIGTVVVPAAWTLTRFLGKSGKEFLTAVLAGYETMSRIGMALGVSAHRNKGWHVTATAGTFGAAAACGKLLGLDVDHMVYALGLAGSQSFGTWAFLGDGASNKVLNPARASVSGCESALLAKAGMTGPEHVLTATDGGILAMMSDAYDVTRVTAGLGSAWEVMQMDNKPYPCCRSMHCVIDGALQIRRQYSPDPEEIERIEIYTYLVGNKQCGMSDGSKRPVTPIDAKFSSPYVAAAALIRGHVGLGEFVTESILDDKVQALLARAEVITENSFTQRYPEHWGCRVEVRMKDGQRYLAEVPEASGSVNSPVTREQLRNKVLQALALTDIKNTEAICDQLERIDTLEVLPAL